MGIYTDFVDSACVQFYYKNDAEDDDKGVSRRDILVEKLKELIRRDNDNYQLEWFAKIGIDDPNELIQVSPVNYKGDISQFIWILQQIYHLDEFDVNVTYVPYSTEGDGGMLVITPTGITMYEWSQEKVTPEVTFEPWAVLSEGLD
jgi:hypothetical protein